MNVTLHALGYSVKVPTSVTHSTSFIVFSSVLSLLARRLVSIDRKHYWNRPVAYPICRSVCVSVSLCPESILWQNGWLDPDSVWGGERGWSRDECIRLDGYHRRGKGSFVVNLERPIVTGTLLRSCAKVRELVELSFEVVSWVCRGMGVLEGVHVPQWEGAVWGIFAHWFERRFLLCV